MLEDTTVALAKSAMEYSIPRIFLSYSTHNPLDEELIRRIAAALDRAGFKTWLATKQLTGGEHWKSCIIQEIESLCSHFLVLWSAAARESQFVRDEVDLAFARYDRDRNFSVIPVLVGANGLDRRSANLREFQSIQYVEDPRFLDAILAAVRKPPDLLRRLPSAQRIDSWTPQLRSLLRAELDLQLRSRNPWTTKEQLARLNRTAMSDFFQRRGGLTPARVVIPNIETHLAGNDNSQAAAGWRRNLEMFIAPTNVAAAGIAVYIRDAMGLPITLRFGHSSGFGIVNAIHRKDIRPDAFVAGDVQALTVGDDYYWTLALATIKDQVVARHQGDFRSPGLQGIYLAPESSTLERAYYTTLGPSAIKRTRLEHMDASDVIDRILLGDLDVRAILWPPLTQMLESSGLTVNIRTPRRSSWNAVLFCSKKMMKTYDPVPIDAFVRSLTYAWNVLKSDTSWRSKVIETLVNDETYSSTTRRMVRYDQIIATHSLL